jgi:hypothetical protein
MDQGAVMVVVGVELVFATEAPSEDSPAFTFASTAAPTASKPVAFTVTLAVWVR